MAACQAGAEDELNMSHLWRREEERSSLPCRHGTLRCVSFWAKASHQNDEEPEADDEQGEEEWMRAD